jgi:hypothetical protein
MLRATPSELRCVHDEPTHEDADDVITGFYTRCTTTAASIAPPR